MKLMLKQTSILCLISFSLIGCTPSNIKFLKEFERKFGLHYIVGSEILFAYDDFKGLDNAGPAYYVFDLGANREKFFDQFNHSQPQLIPWQLGGGTNSDFENRVNNFIEQWFSDVYSTFDEQYKIVFGNHYIYFEVMTDPLEKAFVSYEGSTTVYFLYYQH